VPDTAAVRNARIERRVIGGLQRWYCNIPGCVSVGFGGPLSKAAKVGDLRTLRVKSYGYARELDSKSLASPDYCDVFAAVHLGAPKAAATCNITGELFLLDRE
jgi:hypothetical protein